MPIRYHTLRAFRGHFVGKTLLRFAEVFDDELDFAWGEPFGGLLVALLVEGLAQWRAAVNPTHEVVDSRMWIERRGKVAQGQLLLGVGTDREFFHGLFLLSDFAVDAVETLGQDARHEVERTEHHLVLAYGVVLAVEDGQAEFGPVGARYLVAESLPVAG